MAGTASSSAVDWKVAMRPRPATSPAAAASSACGQLGALQQRAGVPDEHERGVGQAHAAARRLEQLDAGLALEHGQLLRDGRGRELQGVGDRGDRAAGVQLVQQPQPVQVERHAEAMLLNHP